MPVRRVHNRGSNIIGWFPSQKLGRMVSFESTIERDYIYLLEFDPSVVCYEEQPLVISYSYRDRLTSYTPDFLVYYMDPQHARQHRKVVECKPEALLEHPDNQRKFAAARQWCEEHGHEYFIMTDRGLRAGHQLANVKLLTRFAWVPVSPDWTMCVAEVLAGQPNGLSIDDLVERISTEIPNREALSCIYHLMYRGLLVTDLETPLSREARVKTIDASDELPGTHSGESLAPYSSGRPSHGVPRYDDGNPAEGRR